MEAIGTLLGARTTEPPKRRGCTQLFRERLNILGAAFPLVFYRPFGRRFIYKLSDQNTAASTDASGVPPLSGTASPQSTEESYQRDFAAITSNVRWMSFLSEILY